MAEIIRTILVMSVSGSITKTRNAHAMSESGRNLKERLGAIMKNKKRTRIAVIFSAVLLIAVAGTSIALGAGSGGFSNNVATPDLNTIAPAVISEESRQLLSIFNTNNAESLLFDYSTDGSYKYMNVWVEVYEYGVLHEQSSGGSATQINDESSGFAGKLAIQLDADDQFSYKITILSGASRASWDSVEYPDVSLSIGNGRAFGAIDEPVTITDGKEIVLYRSLADAGNGVAIFDAQEYADGGRDISSYPVVVLIKCMFSSDETAIGAPAGHIEPDEKPWQSIEIGMTKSAVEEILGEPSMGLSGFYGDIWAFDDGDEVVVYYSADSMVEGMLVNGEDVLTPPDDFLPPEISQVTVLPTDIETAISQAILNYDNDIYVRYEDAYKTEAHVTLKTVDNGESVTAYVYALSLSYTLEDGQLIEKGGSSMPVAITFKKEPSGAYSLLEYWIPKDGSYYTSSIHEKFPQDLWDKTDTLVYNDSHITALRNAQRYFGINDYDAPKINILRPLEIEHGFEPNWEDYLEVIDNADGKVDEENIHIFDAGCDYDTPGVYSFSMVVLDKAGNRTDGHFDFTVK
jgi:hypothetical protein